MSSRGPYRPHPARFKLQSWQGIRSGELGRRDAQKKCSLSANLIQIWLTQFDNGELTGEELTSVSRMNLRDARAVLTQLPAAFKHFNEVDPHSSLKMKSPREFSRQRVEQLRRAQSEQPALHCV